MTCAELLEFLLDYDEGTLPPEVRAEFEAHLAICPDCVDYLASYRMTIAMGKAVFADSEFSVPQAVPAGLVQAILSLRSVVDENVG